MSTPSSTNDRYLCRALRSAAKGSKQLTCRKPRDGGREPNRCAIARPRPLLGQPAHVRADRVAHDVARHLEKVRLALDELCVVRRFKQVAPTVVPPVEALRVPAVEGSHSSRDVRFGRLDRQVEVISHEAEGEALPLESRYRPAKAVQESAAIEIVGEDRGARVSPRCHLIEAAGDLGPRVTSHLSTIRPLSLSSREGHTFDSPMARACESPRGHVLGPGPGTRLVGA